MHSQQGLYLESQRKFRFNNDLRPSEGPQYIKRYAIKSVILIFCGGWEN